MMRRLGLWLLLWPGLAGCQCTALTDGYGNIVDDVHDLAVSLPPLDRFYSPTLDLTRIGMTDWCMQGSNAALCRRCRTRQIVVVAPESAQAAITPDETNVPGREAVPPSGRYPNSPLPPPPAPPAETENRSDLPAPMSNASGTATAFAVRPASGRDAPADVETPRMRDAAGWELPVLVDPPK